MKNNLNDVVTKLDSEIWSVPVDSAYDLLNNQEGKISKSSALVLSNVAVAAPVLLTTIETGNPIYYGIGAFCVVVGLIGSTLIYFSNKNN